jgi:imidazolonepropionase-like amidohydrolase
LPATLTLRNAFLIDGSERSPQEAATIVVADGRIREVGGPTTHAPDGSRVIDCRGAAVIPGLIDAHVHIGAVDVDFGTQARRKPTSLIAFEMARRLRRLLDLGYTTVRDCGGADWGFKAAVASELIPGPDLVICSAMLSQTGGHGDMRQRAELDEPGCCHAPFGMVFAIADGSDAVRKAVREQIRQGADFVKVMASGGAASPTDKLDCVQYSPEELRLIVEEAHRADTYVAAHALPKVAILQAVRAGVRTIEHGNFLDEESAKEMAEAGSALIPTVATYVIASRHPEKYSDPPEVVAKIGRAAEGALAAVEAAYRAGVTVGSGSDLLGDELSWIGYEHQFRADVVGAAGAIRAATAVNADILGLSDVGRIEVDRRGDIVVLQGNPLEDISVLANPEKVLAVVKAGHVHLCSIPS